MSKMPQDSGDQLPPARGLYRPRVSRSDLEDRPTNLWMIKWVAALREAGGRGYLRDLRRQLNTNKHATDADTALRRLQGFGYIRLEKLGRRTLVTLLRSVPYLERTRPKRTRKHRRRSRGQTEWFKNMLAQKEKEALLDELNTRSSPIFVSPTPSAYDDDDVGHHDDRDDDPFKMRGWRRKPGR